jgi:hypothetical protein
MDKLLKLELEHSSLASHVKLIRRLGFNLHTAFLACR